MIDILYSHFPDPLPSVLWQQYLECLPAEFQASTARYRRWQDQHAHAIGKLLLWQGLKKHGYSRKVLSQLQYTAESRPYLPGNLDFNISHTGNYVICAIAKDISLGIDIEAIKEIDFNDFLITMNEEQWQEIKTAPSPTRKFFEYWTLKESLIKADGRGLTIPLTELVWKDSQLTYDGKKWFFQYIHLADDMPCHIATNKPEITYNLTKVDFKNTNHIKILGI